MKSVFLALALVSSASLEAISAWSTPPLSVGTCDSDHIEIFGAKVGMDRQGNSIALWVQDNENIVAATLRHGASHWGNSVTLYSPIGASFGSEITLAVSPLGTALAAWSAGEEGNTNIYYSFYSPVNGWTLKPGQPIDSSLTDSNEAPNVVLNALNQGAAAWCSEVSGYGDYVIQAAIFDGTNWAPSVAISDIGVGSSLTAPSLGIDAEGNVTAIWQRQDISTSALLIETASYIANTSSWTSPTVLATSTGALPVTPPEGFSILSSPKITMNSKGEAVAVWNTYNFTTFSAITQARPYAAFAWGTLFDVAIGEVSTFPHTAINPDGKALVAFGDGSAIKALFYLTDNTWTDNEEVSDTFSYTAQNPELNVAITGMGQGIVVWTSSNMPIGVFSEGKKNAWRAPSSIALDGINGWPALAANPFGYVIAVWMFESADDEKDLIKSSTMTLKSTHFFAPTNFRGKRAYNTFLMQSECIDDLSWQPSRDPKVVEYRLYSQGKLIATFPRTGPYSYSVRNVNCGSSATYELAAVTAKGLSSSATTTVSP